MRKAGTWELRIWTGMLAGPWFRHLARNRFRISPTRIPMALLISIIVLVNSALAWLQSLLWGRKIASARIAQDPVFVIGHWRSGTTMLHELLTLDPRHSYADTYACFAPSHFLLSRRLTTWWLRLFLPKRRPMDDMGVNWDKPQEDEWGLCNQGIPTPYLTVLFPNEGVAYHDYYDLRNVPPADRNRWKQGWLWFLKCVNMQRPGRLVLKTPQHLGRVRTILEVFPNARFVHIVRDPFVVYASTIKLWRQMQDFYGLQVPRYDGLEERAFETFVRLYDAFEEDRELIPKNHFSEVRYEELVKDPVGELARIYRELGLDDYDAVRPRVEQYAARSKSYRPNQHQLSPEVADQIKRRWSSYLQRYGYAPAAAEATATAG